MKRLSLTALAALAAAGPAIAHETAHTHLHPHGTPTLPLLAALAVIAALAGMLAARRR